MGNLVDLKYPKKSHRKNVTLPKHSKNLAEFFGIMMGDGGINNPWQANITVNSLKDKEYSEYIFTLCKNLFNISPSIIKRKETNALVIRLASTSVVDFLVREGLQRGNKLKNGLRIPQWILDVPLYKKVCVRGLIDTDGCAFIHIHRVKGKIYKNIGLNFASSSPELLFQVAEILEQFGIMPHISTNGKEIFLYRADLVFKYLRVFGTSNIRIQSVYDKWRDARAV